MMPTEFEQFSTAIKVLELVFGKNIDEQLLKLYWVALRDLPLEAVKAGIERHVRYGRFFPKPSELRRPNDGPRDDQGLSPSARRSVHIALLEFGEKDPAKYGHLKPALALNAASWDDFRARDPELAEIEYRLAQVGRTLATELPDSPEYADAVEQDRRLRTLREALWAERRDRRRAA